MKQIKRKALSTLLKENQLSRNYEFFDFIIQQIENDNQPKAKELFSQLSFTDRKACLKYMIYQKLSDTGTTIIIILDNFIDLI